MKQLYKLIIFACALVLIGCGSQETSKSQQIDAKENTPTQQERETEAKKEPQQAASNIEEKATTNQTEDENAQLFEFNTATYENGELAIHYPQLANMKDKDLEQRINQLIKEDATLFLTQYQDSEASLEMTFEVNLSEADTFSILYTGDYNGGMYPTNLVFTTNIDWKKGKKVKLSELFVIDEHFIEALKKSKYLDRENPPEPNLEKEAAVIDYLNSFNTQDFIDALKKADHPNPEENPYGIFSYNLNDAVIISIQVPHALGDHAEFELNLDTLMKK